MRNLAMKRGCEDGIQRITVRIPQALAIIGLGRSKFYELINSGEIETIKVGKATLIVVASLHAFVQQRRIIHRK
jgi:excisionase family DNA binding protein